MSMAPTMTAIAPITIAVVLAPPSAKKKKPTPTATITAPDARMPIARSATTSVSADSWTMRKSRFFASLRMTRSAHAGEHGDDHGGPLRPEPPVRSVVVPFAERVRALFGSAAPDPARWNAEADGPVRALGRR